MIRRGQLQHWILIGVAILVILFLVLPDLQYPLLSFLLVGAIPGTGIVVPPLAMITALMIGLVLFLAWTRNQKFYAEAKRELKRKKPVTSTASSVHKPSGSTKKRSTTRRQASPRKRRTAKQGA